MDSSQLVAAPPNSPSVPHRSPPPMLGTAAAHAQHNSSSEPSVTPSQVRQTSGMARSGSETLTPRLPQKVTKRSHRSDIAPCSRRKPVPQQSLVHKALNGKTLPVPHSITRLNQQLRYIENMNVPDLNHHTTKLRKIFVDLLHLQVDLPAHTRFHLLLESEQRTNSPGKVTNVDLFSLFSTTISTETTARRDSICLLGELLVDFKLLCESEGSAPPTNPSPAHTVNNAHNGSSSHSNQTIPGTVSPLPNTVETAAPSQGDSTSHDECDDDCEDYNNEWFVAPDEVMAKMQLPPWFPAAKMPESEQFNSSTITVDIDRFQHLTYDQAVFVYRGFIRTAHKNSLLEKHKNIYEGNRHYKTVFSFTPFTPPWYVRNIDCRVSGTSVFVPPLQFDEPCIPRKRQFRSRSSPIVVKLQGLIAAFYQKEREFSVATIDYLVSKCTAQPPPGIEVRTPVSNPVLQSTSKSFNSSVPVLTQALPPHAFQNTRPCPTTLDAEVTGIPLHHGVSTQTNANTTPSCTPAQQIPSSSRPSISTVSQYPSATALPNCNNVSTASTVTVPPALQDKTANPVEHDLAPSPNLQSKAMSESGSNVVSKAVSGRSTDGTNSERNDYDSRSHSAPSYPQLLPQQIYAHPSKPTPHQQVGMPSDPRVRQGQKRPASRPLSAASTKRQDRSPSTFDESAPQPSRLIADDDDPLLLGPVQNVEPRAFPSTSKPPLPSKGSSLPVKAAMSTGHAPTSATRDSPQSSSTTNKDIHSSVPVAPPVQQAPHEASPSAPDVKTENVLPLSSSSLSDPPSLPVSPTVSTGPNQNTPAAVPSQLSGSKPVVPSLSLDNLLPNPPQDSQADT